METIYKEKSPVKPLNNLKLRDILRQLQVAPNILSISRIIFLPLVAYLIAWNLKPWSVISLTLLWVTDYIDGYIARHYRKTTDLGLLLDPLADKITSGVLLLVLYFYHNFPLWVVLVVLGRDIIIISLGYYLVKRHRMITSDRFGRASTIVVASIIMLYVLDLQKYSLILCWVLIALIAITLVSYGSKFYKTMKF
jgi:CDP-diacylglycerol--glycerol-3-phosphate 3-phosphatidyltransferase